MAKKRTEPTVQCNTRLRKSTFKKVQEYAEDAGIPPGTMGGKLIAEAIRNREESHEETLLRLLTHFEKRVTVRIAALNHNLRQATGLILTPKPEPDEEPEEDFLIENSTDAAELISLKFREIPD